MTGEGSTAFTRVLLKLSGEALMGERTYGQDPGRITAIARALRSVHDAGVEVAIVVGGGNILRGTQEAARGMDRATADYAGMLATLLNALTVSDALEQQGVTTRVQSAINVSQVAEPYIRRRAIRHLEKGRVVIFAAGTGNPFFTTDTAAALRALEIGAQAILMGKNGVEGVMDADPREHPDARLIPELTHLDAIERGLKVMDTTALSLCMDNRVPLYVFNLDDEANIERVVRGERIGTIISARVPGGGRDMIDDVLTDASRRMEKSVENTRHEFTTVRTGRASAALLDRVQVNAYGTKMPVNQLATIGVPEPRLLTIAPFDKSIMKEIERGILESDLGLTPSNDGQLIRLPIPQLTEERRKDLVKQVRHMAEEGRIAARNIRRDAIHRLKELEKNSETGSDEVHRAEDRLQKQTDEHIHQIDAALKAKEAEIMEV